MNNLDDLLEDKDVQRVFDSFRLQFRSKMLEFVSTIFALFVRGKLISVRAIEGTKEPMYKYHVVLAYRHKTGGVKLTGLVNQEPQITFETHSLEELKQAILDLEIKDAIGDVIRPIKMSFTGETAAKLNESESV